MHRALPLQALPVCLTVRGGCLSEGRSFLPSINCLFLAVSPVLWHYMRLAPLAANTSVKRDLTVESSKFQGSVESWHQITPPELCFNQVQFSSVAQSRPTLCDPINHSTPGLPVHHQLQEFTQTHVHQVGDAIQPSHPLSSPCPPAPNPSQHQSLFQ